MTALIFAVILIAGAVLFTIFIRARDLPQPDPVSATQHLEERRARIYENLRDLQFEFRVGKLSDADYQRTKNELQVELAAVVAEIEQMTPKSAAPLTPQPKTAPARYTCPHCNASFDKPLKFCGECGKPMEAA